MEGPACTDAVAADGERIWAVLEDTAGRSGGDRAQKIWGHEVSERNHEKFFEDKVIFEWKMLFRLYFVALK